MLKRTTIDRRPPWDDEQAVFGFVDWVLAEGYCKPDPDAVYDDLISLAEREAVDAVKKHGDFTLLADLLDPRLGITSWLAPTTYELMMDIIKGKYKRPAKKLPLSEPAKRARYPYYVLADLVRLVQAILKRSYPKVRAYRDSGITSLRDRAVDYVVARHPGTRREKLLKYVKG
ncbi:MAG TPA: hypothetical protein VE999_00975 [Gemmataceae bacterium]|nr:hypothetical protein [Gemmataceae bacterium]